MLCACVPDARKGREQHIEIGPVSNTPINTILYTDTPKRNAHMHMHSCHMHTHMHIYVTSRFYVSDNQCQRLNGRTTECNILIRLQTHSSPPGWVWGRGGGAPFRAPHLLIRMPATRVCE